MPLRLTATAFARPLALTFARPSALVSPPPPPSSSLQLPRALTTSSQCLKGDARRRNKHDPYAKALRNDAVAKSMGLPSAAGKRPGKSISSPPDESSMPTFSSRAAWKLWQLEQRRRFLIPQRRPKGVGAASHRRIVLDLGAAPGGWTEMALYIMRNARDRTKIIALDLQDISAELKNRDDVEFIRGDFHTAPIKAQLAETIQRLRSEPANDGSTTSTTTTTAPTASPRADVILSDMMANTSGSTLRNAMLSYDLLVGVYSFCLDHLAISPASHLVIKVFQSADATAFRKKYCQGPYGAFQHVMEEFVPGTTPGSKEVYWVCKGFKGGRPVDQVDVDASA